MLELVAFLSFFFLRGGGNLRYFIKGIKLVG